MKDQVTEKEVVYDGKWLKLILAKALIRGKATDWLYCSRKALTRAASDQADAVVIVPFVKEADGVKILLIKEYRIPLGRQQIGFPAGLIDPGDDARASVVRELREETGYRVTAILDESPTLATSAGLTDETFQYVFVEAEYLGEAELEPSESIELLKLSLEELDALMKGPNNFCGRAWSLCYNYIQNKKFPL